MPSRDSTKRRARTDGLGSEQDIRNTLHSAQGLHPTSSFGSRELERLVVDVAEALVDHHSPSSPADSEMIATATGF